MKIVISDYEHVMESDYTVTIQAIEELIPDAEICIIPYKNEKVYFDAIADAEGLITAFLPIDDSFLKKAKKLRCISLSAAGYGNVELEKAYKYGINICHIEEYCTTEVAEHTIALMLALNRNVKYYTRKIEEELEWKFYSIGGGKPISEQTLAVFGFGKIGKKVAEFAQGLGMKVVVVDLNVTEKEAINYKVTIVTPDRAFEIADVISNHMNATAENVKFFDESVFTKMMRCPIFLNMGRGVCVDEKALLTAIQQKKIRGAGLDVLAEEEPILDGNPLLKLDHVIITPHSAFYSEESIRKLQQFSGRNLAYCLLGRYECVKKMVSSKIVNDKE